MAKRQAEQAAAASMAGLWWVFLISGMVWFLISLVVLRFTDTSITTVGVIMGVVFVVAGFTEFVAVWLVSGGWKVFHGLIALFFLLAGIWAFTQPKQAFWALASVLGFLLLVVGTFDVLQAVVTKEINPLWWLGLVTGILFIVLAFWASQQLVEVKGQLLLFYVGLFALFRGVSQIVFAFQVRSASEELAAA
jgi:uncharacterized membrane protein HdeD (DUF308 family)